MIFTEKTLRIACFCCTKGRDTPKFRGVNFREQPQNRKIRKRFLPQKFPAILSLVLHMRYISYMHKFWFVTVFSFPLAPLHCPATWMLSRRVVPTSSAMWQQLWSLTRGDRVCSRTSSESSDRYSLIPVSHSSVCMAGWYLLLPTLHTKSCRLLQELVTRWSSPS